MKGDLQRSLAEGSANSGKALISVAVFVHCALDDGVPQRRNRDVPCRPCHVAGGQFFGQLLPLLIK